MNIPFDKLLGRCYIWPACIYILNKKKQLVCSEEVSMLFEYPKELSSEMSDDFSKSHKQRQKEASMEHHLGAQLYIFSKQYQLDRDIDLLLEGLAQSGYHAIEGGPEEAAVYAKKLQQHGMRLCGHHIVTAHLLDLSSVLDYMRTLEVSDLNVSGPLRWFERSPQDYRQAADILNKAAKVLKKEGIRLHYHNHDFEFKPIEGRQTAMDILLDSLDFTVLDLCVDLGFVWLAGSDPLAFLLRHADKIDYVHLRDFAGKVSTELGHGEMPLPTLIEQIKIMRAICQVVVEQDPVAADPFASMAESLRYLRTRDCM